MVFDIAQLKKIRRRLDLTQYQFAKEAGISQSMIAKLEAGKLDPTYSKVKQIEQALSTLMHKEEVKANEIMSTKIISISLGEKMPVIIELMRKDDISQLPVIERGKVIGLVSESSILSKNIKDFRHATAQDAIVETPPIISEDTRMEVIKQLLTYYSILLVENKGELTGVITRSDLMKTLVKQS